MYLQQHRDEKQKEDFCPCCFSETSTCITWRDSNQVNYKLIQVSTQHKKTDDYLFFKEGRSSTGRFIN